MGRIEKAGTYDSASDDIFASGFPVLRLEEIGGQAELVLHAVPDVVDSEAVAFIAAKNLANGSGQLLLQLLLGRRHVGVQRGTRSA